MKSAAPVSNGPRSSFRWAGGLICLLSGLSLTASEPASISAASSKPAPLATGSDKSSSDSKTSTPESEASGNSGWSSRDLLDNGSWWKSSSELSRPSSVNPITPSIDYGTQKRLWEQIDRRRHWMFGDSDPGSAFGPSATTFDSATFEPTSSLPRSVLQKRAMDDILHPGSKKDRRGDSQGLFSDESGDAGARRGFLDTAPARGDRGERARTEGWSLRNATDVGSFLDWDNRSRGASTDFNGAPGNGYATQTARENRERANRFDEMFRSSGLDINAGSTDQETRAGLGNNGLDSRRERLERLFDHVDSVSESAPRPATAGSAGALGRAQRNELFGDGTGNAAGPVRRSKSAEEAARRPIFQPQPGELPLPKPNGL